MEIDRRLPKGSLVRTDRDISGTVLHAIPGRRFVRLPNATGWFPVARLREISRASD